MDVGHERQQSRRDYRDRGPDNREHIGPWEGSRLANTRYHPHTLRQYRETRQMKRLGNISIRNDQQSEETVFT